MGNPSVPDVQYPDDPVSNPSTIRIEDLLAADQSSPPATPPVREGLPRSFRMRADKHYVEMLDAPQPATAKESPVTSTPMAPTTEAARETRDKDAMAAAVRAGHDLAQSLSALRASSSLLNDRGGLASTVAANLIRAEAWRATCLLQASRFLRGEIAASSKSVHARAVLDQALDAIEAERRLRAVVIDRRMSLGDRRIATDEQLLVVVLSGLLMTMIARTEAADAVVTISAEPRGNDVAFTFTPSAETDPYWARQAEGLGFTQVVAGIGGRVTIPTPEADRVCLTFPVIPSALS
jgi:signal transduction histidine kinase